MITSTTVRASTRGWWASYESTGGRPGVHRHAEFEAVVDSGFDPARHIDRKHVEDAFDGYGGEGTADEIMCAAFADAIMDYLMGNGFDGDQTDGLSVVVHLD